jgi:uncharacterized protein with HEPN domain
LQKPRTSFEPREYLRHILDEAEYLLTESRGLTEARFLEDGTLQRAFVRSLEIMGEATKKLPPAFLIAHPEVEWSAMARTRDQLIHGYFAVDYKIVWDVVREDIPVLKRQIETLVGSSL